MNESQYRQSTHRAQLAVFLGSGAGLELMAILRKATEPKMVEIDAKEGPLDREYVQFRMALEQATQMAQHKLIRKIELLSKEAIIVKHQVDELEDDSDAALEAELKKPKP